MTEASSSRGPDSMGSIGPSVAKSAADASPIGALPAANADSGSSAAADMAYSVSWNLTQRCNREGSHCYVSAFAGADARGELSTDECRRVMDEIALVNPNVFLILTGGEPLLRRDIWDIAAYVAEKRFTPVLGTNGVLLRE